jgi:glycylpeptide N-tetradecanoyltransferase
MAQVNFVAVHKALRGKRMAVVLMNEMTRRTHSHGINQAIYSTDNCHPSPTFSVVPYNRFLNIKKLLEVGMTTQGENTFNKLKGLYRLPDKKGIHIVGNIRPIEERDIPTVLKLMNKQLDSCTVKPKWTIEEAAHHLIGRDEIVYTWVVDNHLNGQMQVSDFISITRTTQKITTKNSKYLNQDMYTANLGYYGLSQNTLLDMVKQTLWYSVDLMNCDNYIALSLMSNAPKIF